MTVRNINDVTSEKVAAGTSTFIQVLISSQEGPHFAMRRFVIQPGGGMPLHSNTLEHEQYVLNGKARVRIGEQEFQVKTGDVLFIPEGESHSYTNTGKEDFIFLCVIPNQPDEIKLVEGGC